MRSILKVHAAGHSHHGSSGIEFAAVALCESGLKIHFLSTLSHFSEFRGDGQQPTSLHHEQGAFTSFDSSFDLCQRIELARVWSWGSLGATDWDPT